MRRLFPILAALAAMLFLGATYFITQDQARTSGVLTELKFELVPETSGRIGAPPKFRVTKLQKEGKLVEIQGDGAVKAVASNEAPKSKNRERY